MSSKFYLIKSPLKTKKFRIIINDKHVDFGALGYSDYTLHKDEDRKNRYINRHRKNENWNDYYSAGYWSRWLLWEEPTLKKAIKNIENMLNVRIIYKK